MENVFISSTDIYNRKVILEQEQFDDHIIAESGHIEMADDPTSITATVETPDYIYESSQKPTRDVYFGKDKHKDYPNEFVKVIVDFTDNPDEGFVVSAWTQSEVKGGVGRLKYEKAPSK